MNDIQVLVEKALDEVRPFLIEDGGNVSLVSIENNHVSVRFEGACISCNINKITLKTAIESTIKKYAPQIETVTNIG